MPKAPSTWHRKEATAAGHALPSQPSKQASSATWFPTGTVSKDGGQYLEVPRAQGAPASAPRASQLAMQTLCAAQRHPSRGTLRFLLLRSPTFRKATESRLGSWAASPPWRLAGKWSLHSDDGRARRAPTRGAHGHGPPQHGRGTPPLGSWTSDPRACFPFGGQLRDARGASAARFGSVRMASGALERFFSGRLPLRAPPAPGLLRT